MIKILSLLLLMLLMFTAGCGTVASAENLVVYFLNVGQADAAILQCGDEVMMIDGGESSDSSLIYSYLTKTLGITHIDYMIATHPHADHIGGLSGALNACSVGVVYSPVTSYDSKQFSSLVKYTQKQGCDLTVPEVGDSFAFGDAQVQFLSPMKEYSNINDCSIVVRITHGNNAFLGVDVFFEREGIHSMSGEGELLLTLLASFAQAEAESISANEKWSVQKRFERGEPNTGILCFGYDWNPETKSLTINEEEGKWVKYIYEQYLAGASIKGLTIDLKEKGVRGKRGDLMGRTTLRRILSTETYVGDLLLQRYFSPEIHKPKLNEGEMEQILVSNAHEPLVSREDYAKVQERLNRRAKAADNHGYEKTFFAGLVKCGKCGYACNHVLYHRQPADKAYIECNKRKTKECDLLPIRELELKGIMEQIAGCRENVERITLFDGHIDFLMKDGTVKSHIRKYSGDGFNKTPFSRKIFCGYCGSSIVRMGGNKRRTCWMCSVKKADKAGCEHELMSDGELYGAAQSILGTEENLDMEIYLHIGKTISYNDRIEFYMKEGGKKVWERR